MNLIDAGRPPICQANDEGGYLLLEVPLEATKDLEGIVAYSLPFGSQRKGDYIKHLQFFHDNGYIGHA
jgi:hypothetical protein